MILSMTGFGRGVAESDNRKITVEIKSLNSKQLDLFMRVPPYFREMEIEVRNLMAPEIERGKVELQVIVENTAGTQVATFNMPALKSYKAQLEEMNRELALPSPEDWYATLLRLPETLQTKMEEVDDADRKALFEALKEAVNGLTSFRTTEGSKLYKFFCEKIANIGTLLSEVEPFEQERVEKIRRRLEEQLASLHGIDYDRGRLEQELIFYIEKLDVSEEKLRLRSHLDYFLETMGGESDKRAAAGQGKKLGFIAQEMGREINTLGSKSNNADMQKIVVKMKDELEQIKEQVLNVL